jgi:hypothetical protein
MTVRLTHAFSSFIALHRALKRPPVFPESDPVLEDAVMDCAGGGPSQGHARDATAPDLLLLRPSKHIP